MRENFTAKTKQILAGRVNYKCSFPGCLNPTIGPSGINEEGITNLGEAAHIYAASIHGPRANPQISKDELSSVKNGIWMCRNHARLIDVDPDAFSAATLRLWKNKAEASALKAIKNGEKDLADCTTLVSLSNNLIFEGFWIDAKENNTWVFSVIRFIYGNIKMLRELSTEVFGHRDVDYFICIESQGDGRLIKNSIDWNLDTNTGFYTITVTLENKENRIFLNDLGADIKLDDDLDLDITNGDFSLISGAELAKQRIQTIIAVNYNSVDSGYPVSFIHKYFNDHKSDKRLLERLVKLDLARLINIPFKNKIRRSCAPALNFINRIIDVEIPSTEIVNNKIPIKLRLEWKDGNYWQDKIDLLF